MCSQSVISAKATVYLKLQNNTVHYYARRNAVFCFHLKVFFTWTNLLILAHVIYVASKVNTQSTDSLRWNTELWLIWNVWLQWAEGWEILKEFILDWNVSLQWPGGGMYVDAAWYHSTHALKWEINTNQDWKARKLCWWWEKISLTKLSN